MKKLFILTLLVVIGLSANAQTAYIAGGDKVYVINVATNTVIDTIAVGDDASGVSVSSDGSKVYIANLSGNTVNVINTATNIVTATIPVDGWTQGICVSPDGSKVYVASIDSSSVNVINTSTNTVIAKIKVGAEPAGVSVSPDGSMVYVTNCSPTQGSTVSVINTATNTVTATIHVGVEPAGISVSPDGTKVYVGNANSGSVSVINTTTNAVSATITVGNFPFGVSVSPDGTKVYVSNEHDNTVNVINAATNTVSATITVGNSPNGTSVSPDGSKVYVVNTADNTVSVISTATNNVTATIGFISADSFGNFIGCNNTGDTTATAHNSFTWNDSTYTSTPIIAPNKILKNKTGCDSVVTLHLTITTTGIEEISNTGNISVFPNPVTEEIQVISNQCSVNSVEIYNILGEKVYQSLVTSHSLSGISLMTNVPITINVADFPKGVYFITLTTEEGKAVKKFVKE